MNRNTKLALAAATVAAFTLPIFSSGLRRELTFIRWLWGHTRWGPFPTYVPREIISESQSVGSGVDEFGIRHVDGQYYAMKRFTYLERDIREWVTPNDPLVKEYACALWDSDPNAFILNAWHFVCSEFNYAREVGDFWYFPEEVLRSHQKYSEAMAIHEEMRLPTMPPRRPGFDCEDLGYALTSLLIAGGADAHANIGYCDTVMHAWATVTIGGSEYILEPTLSGRTADIMLRANPWMAAEDYPEYRASYRFNHISVDHLTNE